MSIDGDACTWGCDSARCNDGTWSVTLGAKPCPPPQPASCPATQPRSGDPCSDVTSSWCRYDGGTMCGCFDCGPYGAPCAKHVGKRWACASPAQGCPTNPPDLGTACATEGSFCSYGPAPCFGPEVVCAGGEWYGTVRVCPM